jgi:hypothetical protein
MAMGKMPKNTLKNFPFDLQVEKARLNQGQDMFGIFRFQNQFRLAEP